MGNLSTGRVRVKNFSRKRTCALTCFLTQMLFNVKFCHRVRAFKDRTTLYVYNIKSSVQNNLPVMLLLDDDWMKFEEIF